jgi:hypothetical protein
MVYGGYGHPIGIGKKKFQWIDDDDHPSQQNKLSTNKTHEFLEAILTF